MTRPQRRTVRRLLTGAGLILLTGVASAAGYTIQELTITGFRPTDINNSGQMIGTITDAATGLSVGAFWNGSSVAPLTPLPYPADWPAGSLSYAEADRLNNSGQIAGGSYFLRHGGGSGSAATVWQNLTPQALGLLPGYTMSRVGGINDSGLVVGTSSCWPACDGETAATAWHGGAPTDLGGLPGHTVSGANGVNNAGDVVGFSGPVNNGSEAHATLWHSGQIIDLGSGSASGINDVGTVIGQIGHTGGGAAYWSDGSTIPTLLEWGNYDVATDINQAGDIVGSRLLVDGPLILSHGMIFSHGKSTDINALMDVGTWTDVVITSIVANNDAGQLLATGQTFTGKQLSLLLNPCADCDLVNYQYAYERYLRVSGIPEASAWAYVAVGLGFLLWVARCRVRGSS